MPKTQMHSFWILPKGVNLFAERTLEERIEIWGCVPMYRGGPAEAAEELTRYLLDFSSAKDYLAIHVSNRMMMESIQSFMSLQVLNDGYLPCRGLSVDKIAVIPNTELQEMIDILGTFPQCASWKRLRSLCQGALAQNNHVLYRGIIPQFTDDSDISEEPQPEDE